LRAHPGLTLDGTLFANMNKIQRENLLAAGRVQGARDIPCVGQLRRRSKVLYKVAVWRTAPLAVAVFCIVLLSTTGSYAEITIPVGREPAPDPALNSAGAPIIVFYDSENENLKCAQWVDDDWEIPTPDSSGSVGEWASVAIDNRDYIYISYYDAGNDNLKFAYFNGTKWKVSAVDESGDVGKYTSIAVSSGRVPYISYYDATNGDLKLAKTSGASWSSVVLDSTGDVGKWTSIVLDGSGRPHISYYDVTNGDLKYARWTGSAWNTETVDSQGDVGKYSSIALDGSGRPHISYYDATNGNLKYAQKTGPSWTTETLDSTGDVGLWASIAVDASYQPHISYYDATEKDLKYTTRTLTWSVETLDSDGITGLQTGILLTSTGKVNIAYYDSTDSEIQYYEEYEDPESPFNGWEGKTIAARRRKDAIRLSASPNPFLDETSICLRISAHTPMTASIVVYDILGRNLGQIWEGPISPGTVSLKWKGTDSSELPLPSGLYILKATIGTAEGRVQTRSAKVVITR